VKRFGFAVATILLCLSAARAQPVKPIPPTGNALDPKDRAELEAGALELGRRVETLRQSPVALDLSVLLPDVQIYHNAVRYPLQYDEPIAVPAARAALAEGMRRATALQDGKPDWLYATGPRGYVSRIDGSVQPYLLVVPKSFEPADPKPRRLDFFCHGRDEALTELKFLSGKLPADAGDHFLVNLYGRFCNANKFAGEIDLLEALESMKRRYPVDENRVVVTGFSMGGAACWQFAVHYSDLFAAASPGAGFAETPRYLRLPNGGADEPWWQRKLWHWYDCTDYAANLFNLPTIAYAGELDPQKKASDEMEAAMKAEGLVLERLTGPGTKHAYHPETKKELDRRLAEYAARGRNPVPPKVRFTTWTLRYNRMHWLTVDGLERHWEPGRVDAEVSNDSLNATTQNVSALTVNLPASGGPFADGVSPAVVVDGTRIKGPAASRGQPWTVRLTKGAAGWQVAPAEVNTTTCKRHGLQGPIDDAFLDSFVFVTPSGRPLNDQVGRYVAAESDHAVRQWQKVFRGEARVKRDEEVAEADILNDNLVLWGDPSSNRLLAKIVDRLPVKWTADGVQVGDKTFASAHHVPVLIYPNPLNPRRYVVLNSGFTFREADNASNARQVPKLPDYAVIDVTVPADARSPGGVVAAGFFDERWQLQPDDGKGASQ
jgi:dienelactone hydrolase